MLNRQRLSWAIATRRQLERWEPLVARYWRAKNEGREPNQPDIWTAQTEHHFALVAGHHLIQALDLPAASGVSIDPTLRAELIEGRHLHEHWVENMPIFNVTPRQSQPRFKSGQAYAARNPERSAYPYWWLGLSIKKGAMLLPHVSAPEVHQVLDAVESEVIAKDGSLQRFMPERAPSPWLHESGEWWPKAI